MEVSFLGGTGHRLAATLELPSGARRPPPVVVFAHGFGVGGVVLENVARGRACINNIREEKCHG